MVKISFYKKGNKKLDNVWSNSFLYLLYSLFMLFMLYTYIGLYHSIKMAIKNWATTQNLCY